MRNNCQFRTINSMFRVVISFSHMRNVIITRNSYLVVLSMFLLLTSCYHKHERKTSDAITYTEEQLDSISFSGTHHYTNNYNFVVKADSLVLLKQQPEEKLNSLMTDSFVVMKNDPLVVADIRIIPTDSIDSVWVQLARDQFTFGWIHETTLLDKVVPDDPISQFISTFSDVHMLIFLIIIVVIGAVYIFRMIRSRNAKLVHFNDIDSFILQHLFCWWHRRPRFMPVYKCLPLTCGVISTTILHLIRLLYLRC